MNHLDVLGERGTAAVLARAVFTHGVFEHDGHAKASHTSLSEQLASLLELPFAGDCAAFEPFPPSYLIPRATLCGREVARRYGIQSEDDFFGGWVPRGWMATKAIMHPVVPDAEVTPPDWLDRLAHQACEVALRGFSAFSLRDAYHAGKLMLKSGPVRLKPAGADGGRSQLVARNEQELEAALAIFCVNGRLGDILTIEEELEEAATFSVGQVRLAGRRISYCGTQSTTLNNAGESAYGGSWLFAVPGDHDELLSRQLPDDMRMAIAQAVAFDAMADRHVPGLIASRRNYDVIGGTDAAGRARTGVLEQSWRLGGATGAELAALEVFLREPHVSAVHARTVEVYGEAPDIPAGARIHYQGHDPVVGALTKYACVEEKVEG